MDQNRKLKLFISYSHQDNFPPNQYIEQFKKHISPLKDKGLIEEWYDRRILLGDEYQSKIDHNLDEADVICLFISANYLDSLSCKTEKRKALELRKKKGVLVIPIILSPCGWIDDADISQLLASPTDGKPVSEFEKSDTAWQDVYNNLKRVIEKELIIRQLKINQEFQKFLQDTEILTKAHSHKESVSLDDIFICTELARYDDLKEYEEAVSSEELLHNLFDNGKIIIAGEAQSGKTTLCKKMFTDLRIVNFIPVYVSGKKTNSPGKIKNKILDSIHEQYQIIDMGEIDEGRIIPIIDDFHHAKNREKHIEDLSKYPHCVIIVDDIFGLNIKNGTLLSSFATFRIKELKPSLRNQLIEKWESLTDKDVGDNYKNIDKNTELINTTLGKNIGKGIMPAYPFFILSTIVTYETLMPLDQEITSQGYCYQAFILHYLRKRGVRSDEIDIYLNFLTELSFYIFKEKKDAIDSYDFTSFMNSYLETYNLPIKQDYLLMNLSEIILEDSFKNYSFKHFYFYYYFVAKYLSEHMEDSTVIEEIGTIINNLHVDENAYVAVFLTHHSKNINILREIENIALSLFDKHEPATLTKKELIFFDEQAHNIVKLALPSANVTPEKERAERLNHLDELEQYHEERAQDEENDENNPLIIELRRAIKTVEVMGCIIRNRAGSLKKVELESIFMNGMNIHLRILSNLFKSIQNEDEQERMVNFIIERLDHLDENTEPHKRLSEEKKREYARIIFWNLSFFTTCGIINKIVHSLGSDKLTEIIISVCDEVHTPASFLIKHGILMEYNKNLLINDLAKGLHENDFSKIAKQAIKLMVINHCSLHVVKSRDRQRIRDKLKITSIKFIQEG